MKQQPDASSTPVSRRYAVGLAGALTLAGSSLALAGCSNSDSPASDASDAPDTATSDVQSSAGEGATLVMALSVDPDGLDPQRTAAAATFEITNNVYDPLIRVDADNNLVPGLAQSWEVSDDGLSATFHLREGVAFSNGNPCDAAAVVASFLRLQAEDSPRVSEYANYSFSYDEDDPTTVTVESGTLNVAMLTDFAYAWAAVVDVSVADTLANKPVGTGPYTVDELDAPAGAHPQGQPLVLGGAPDGGDRRAAHPARRHLAGGARCAPATSTSCRSTSTRSSTSSRTTPPSRCCSSR